MFAVRSRVLALVAVFLAPLLVLAVPSVARAAGPYGETTGHATVTVSDSWRPGTDVSCEFAAYYQVDVGQHVKFKAGCTDSWNTAFDRHTVDEVAFKGHRLAGGAACQMTAADLPVSGAKRFAGTANAAVQGPGLPNDCAVEEVCFTSHDTQENNWDRHLGPGCAGIDLGVIPGGAGATAENSCSFGSVTKPVVGGPEFGTAKNLETWYQQISVSITSANEALPGGGGWQPYVVARSGPQAFGFNYWFAYKVPGGENGTGATIGTQYPDTVSPYTPGVTQNLTDRLGIGDYGAAPRDPAYNAEIIGVGVVLNRWASDGMKLPNVPWQANGHLGVTDAADCSWYWGTKLYDDVNSTRDDPAGTFAFDEVPGGGGPGTVTDPDPVDPTPPAAAAGCDFALTDPGSWLSGGMCALVGLLGRALDILRSIFNAIIGLPGAIISGIGDLLTSLFVPDSVVLGESVDGLRDKWDDTAIGKWKTAVTGQSYAMPSAGCGGVPVMFTLPGGVDVDLQLGEACSGTMANAAGIIRTILSAGLVIFGGIACVRAIGSGFGWSPTIGRGGDPT